MDTFNFEKEPFYNTFTELEDDVLTFYNRIPVADIPDEVGLNFDVVAYDDFIAAMLGLDIDTFMKRIYETDDVYETNIYWWPKSHVIHVAVENLNDCSIVEKIATGNLGDIETLLKQYAERVTETSIEQLLLEGK